MCSQMIFQKEIRVQHCVCSILALLYLFHRINPRWRFFYIRVFPHFFWGQAQAVEVYERGPVIIEAEQFGIGAVSFITVCIMPATIYSEYKVSALNTASFSSGLKVHYQPPCPSHRKNSSILFKVAFGGHFHQVALALHHRLLVVFGRHDNQYRFLAHDSPQLTKKRANLKNAGTFNICAKVAFLVWWVCASYDCIYICICFFVCVYVCVCVCVCFLVCVFACVCSCILVCVCV